MIAGPGPVRLLQSSTADLSDIAREKRYGDPHDTLWNSNRSKLYRGPGELLAMGRAAALATPHRTPNLYATFRGKFEKIMPG